MKRIHSTFSTISFREEIPFKSWKLNFDDKLFVTAYNTLFSGTGKLRGNSGSIIKREDYSEG